MEQRDDATEASANRLMLLNTQADAVRAELAQLRADLAATRNEFSKLRSTELARVGETLVEAAAQADMAAQFAVSSLGDLNLYSQLDELTGLPTRTLMLDRLETMVLAAERRGSRVGVVFLDLDGFKQINDSLGHGVGDQVLQVATRQLLSVVRESDTVSRHGGDEFILLFPEISHAADLAPMADILLSALATPMHLGGEVLRLSASIGIAIFPDDGMTASALLSHADEAMYCSKKSGRGRYTFHAEAPDCKELEPAPPRSIARRADTVFAEHEARLHALGAANQGLLEAARNDQKMRAHAELAHRHQIDFVAMAAHAMRTPLSVITSNASLMKREATTPTAAKRVEAIERHSRHLDRLIADLLDGSMVGGGEFKLDYTTLSFDAVIDSAVEAARIAFTSKQQTLHLATHRTPGSLTADAMRITQLFANLLKNASRRAPDGGDVWLSVETEAQTAVFMIADNGVEIGNESLESIFELYTLDQNLPAHESGLGIGLAVARELARAHGGSIVARNSKVSRRTEFLVRLPCEPSLRADASRTRDRPS